VLNHNNQDMGPIGRVVLPNFPAMLPDTLVK
jgi:hypothetical protein